MTWLALPPAALAGQGRLPTLELLRVEEERLHFVLRNDTGVPFDYDAGLFDGSVSKTTGAVWKSLEGRAEWFGAEGWTFIPWRTCGIGFRVGTILPGESITDTAWVQRPESDNRVRLRVRKSTPVRWWTHAWDGAHQALPGLPAPAGTRQALWQTLHSESTTDWLKRNPKIAHSTRPESADSAIAGANEPTSR